MNLEDVLKIGTRAAQPAANTVAEGTLYSITDENNLVEQSNGIAWVTYAGGGSGGGSSSSIGGIISPLPIDGEDGLDGFPGLTGPIGATGASGGAGSSVILPSLTPPVDGDFAWINQGGASVSLITGGIYISSPAGSGVQWRIRKKAAPATPYTITAVFLWSGFAPDFLQFGLLFRQSSDGKLHGLTIQANTASLSSVADLNINSVKYTSPTVYSNLYLQTQFAGGRLVIMRIADDGTNRICSVSPDGINWIPMHSIGRTDFLTADEIGFGIDSANVTFANGVTLISWLQA